MSESSSLECACYVFSNLCSDFMKAEQLTDVTIQEPKSEIVIELSNGQRVATHGYFHDRDKRGGEIIVLKAGRKLDKT